MKITIRQVQPKYEWQTRLTVTNAKCKVCKTKFKAGSHFDERRLRTVGICSTCDFWIEKWQLRDRPNVARVNGQHYMYGNHLQDARVTQDATLEAIAKSWDTPKRQGLGMGGDKMLIRFHDGRVVTTNDLWHQGDIPQRFAHLMPDNAVMERLA